MEDVVPSEPESGEEQSDVEEMEEELPDVDHLAGGPAPPRTAGKRRHETGRDSGSVSLVEMKDFMGSLLNNNFQGMKEMMRENAELSRAQRKEEILELKQAKKRKTEDEMLETEAELAKFDGVSVRDNCRDVINADLRVQLSGPYGDPAAWWTSKMHDEKPGVVIGDALDYTHLLGAGEQAGSRGANCFSVCTNYLSWTDFPRPRSR